MQIEQSRTGPAPSASGADGRSGRPPGAAARYFSGGWLRWGVLAGSSWLVIGAHLDSWAHNHLLIALETVFTPWHAVLYSGDAVTTLYLAGAWRVSGGKLPGPYSLSFLGCVLFLASGLADLAWHLAFGIERGIAALFSPTHLALGISACLIVTGPLRDAWQSRSRNAGWAAVLSATLLFTFLTYFTQYNQPYVMQLAAHTTPPPGFQETPEVIGMMGILFQAATLSGVLLLLLRRFRLPIGALTVMLGVNAIFVTSVNRLDPIALVAVLAGLLGDYLIAWLRPSPLRPLRLRVVAFSVPAVLYLLYFLALITVDGVWWPVHFWTGAIVLSGLMGWLLSWLVVPPRLPAAADPYRNPIPVPSVQPAGRVFTRANQNSFEEDQL